MWVAKPKKETSWGEGNILQDMRRKLCMLEEGFFVPYMLQGHEANTRRFLNAGCGRHTPLVRRRLVEGEDAEVA